MALSVDDYEKEFLLDMLGGSALATDSLQDLRYKFYKGVYDGTIVIGGGGGSSFTEYGDPRVGDWVTAPDIKSYVPNGNGFRTSGAGPYMVVPVRQQITVDALQLRVDTGEAASTIRMGIYSCNSNGLPTTKVSDVSVSGVAAGLIIGVLGAPVVLPSGLYALVARASSIATLRLRCCVPTQHGRIGINNIPVGDNEWIGADFGTSAALNANIAAYSLDLPDNTVLIGMRRSA